MRPPEIVIRLDRKGLILVAVVALVVAGGRRLWSESLTLATTYPSPAGIYNQLITTGNSGAVVADTTFNRNAGNTILVPATNVAGRVGIGTSAPGAKLEVAGAIKITGGAPGAGKVLTSDASGLASWQSAGGGQRAVVDSNFVGSGGWAVATCPVGYTVTGGGGACYWADQFLRYSCPGPAGCSVSQNPLTANQWSAVCTAGAARAWAICAQ